MQYQSEILERIEQMHSSARLGRAGKAIVDPAADALEEDDSERQGRGFSVLGRRPRHAAAVGTSQ